MPRPQNVTPPPAEPYHSGLMTDGELEPPSWLYTFQTAGLGMCGCIEEDDVAAPILNYLRGLDYLSHGPSPTWQERLDCFATEVEFFLASSLLDLAGMIEHGGNIGGAWITDHGRAWLVATRDVPSPGVERAG